MSETLLIIDCHQNNHLEQAIEHKLPYHVVKMHSGDEALSYLAAGQSPMVDAVLIDMEIPAADGHMIIQRLKTQYPQLPVIALVAYGDDKHAASTLKFGAHDYLTKPVGIERLRITVQNAIHMRHLNDYIDWLMRRITGHIDFSDIIGVDPTLLEAVAIARQAASTRMPVWIEGESGTGKEMLARAIHGSGERAGKAFVAVHCQALSEEVLEALLFGQEQETNFNKMHYVLGKLREAEQGTLYLEEVQALKPKLQQRLLGMFRNEGTVQQGRASLDIRIICGVSPKETRIENMFDPKLHQYLHGISIQLPALYQRSGDIVCLSEHFLTMHAVAENRHMRGFTPEALAWLKAAMWPGNIRQLSHTIWRALMLCRSEMLDAHDLEAVKKMQSTSFIIARNDTPVFVDEHGHVRKLKSIEAEAIRYAVTAADGCMTRAARNLGIGRSTLYRKVSELGIEQKKIA